jgi:ubiquinone/menaquinone biosynthesis C-methylase UbiE
MEFHNTYEEARRASAYDELELEGTYYLAFRELPGLLREHVTGKQAVDFGCGTGRSTRFLQQLGFKTVGLDISGEMVTLARERDQEGDYRVIEDGDFSSLANNEFDLVQSAFTFDNIPGHERRIRLFTGLGRLLRLTGRLIAIASTPEIYTNEWVTFSTRDFPDNASARSGDIVRIVVTTSSDNRPVDDIMWTDEDYRTVFGEAGLEIERVERPLGTEDEDIQWVSETRVAPWAIYILRPVY